MLLLKAISAQLLLARLFVPIAGCPRRHIGQHKLQGLSAAEDEIHIILFIMVSVSPR